MSEHVEIVRSSGLATIAFLKAQIDGGSDHLGMFMPLVLDSLQQIKSDGFAVVDAQDAIKQKHGLNVPQPTLTSLLKRATSKGMLTRDAGRYWKTDKLVEASGTVTSDKASIETDQARLAAELRAHAGRRGISLASTDAALDALIKFVEREHIGLLLHEPMSLSGVTHAEDVLRGLVAEFVTTVVATDPALSVVLNRILEGLVLYHAAFQENINPDAKTFKDLTVIFDSNLVRQAIGYEGEAPQRLMRETIEVLKAAGVSCLVFDKTVDEIHRILSMYQVRLGTQAGRQSLRAVPMARHFLTQRYSPADVVQMAALLESDIKSVGLRVQQLPARIPEYTSKEAALAHRFANQNSHGEQEPRVVHDVDCVAGVLVLRRGRRSTKIDEAKAVFATSSVMVIRNSLLWWHEDEKEFCIEPVVHIRALANIAWLKRPKLSGGFKLRELISLCYAAMRPSQSTWDRFLKHLKALQNDQRLTSDEAAAIVVSNLSDQFLRDAELQAEDGGDFDSSTLNEVVERVQASYKASSDKVVGELSAAHVLERQALVEQVRLANDRANAAERSFAEIRREQILKIDRRVRICARAARWSVVGVLSLLVLAGAFAIFLGHHFPDGPTKYVIVIAILVFLVLEILGVLHHVSDLGKLIESKVSKLLRKFWAISSESEL